LNFDGKYTVEISGSCDWEAFQLRDELAALQATTKSSKAV
jgi:hypothetical protein